ncbi:MAG: ArnT family glycosyltransferase [Tenacibaculum sp.]
MQQITTTKITYKKASIALILLSTFVRLFLAAKLEFGNDEVYYWLYAKYPDISHFDHPPFIGFFIQFFTFNLFFDSELAIRLSAVIPASINMFIIFLIAKNIKDERLGFLAVILYNLNIYGLVISGTFILPDSPLLLFWLLSFYFLMQALPLNPSKENRKKLLLAFVFIGCALYSKYQAVFLLLGVVLYVVFINRKWLKERVFYLAFLFPTVAVALIFYWNFQNNFISYKFHNNRVALFSLSFNKDSFLQELIGQCLYNNPYIFVLFIGMLFAVLKKKFTVQKQILGLFFLFSLPLIFTTIYLSLYKSTLPHWSGVSYINILPLLALYIHRKKNIIRNSLIGLLFLYIVLVFASFEINKGWFLPVEQNASKELLGRKDPLMDIYGWKQASDKLSSYLENSGLKQLYIVCNKWYPAAHIDYYIARPNSMKVYVVGDLHKIHKYHWINNSLANTKTQKEFLYITDSRNYQHPAEVYTDKYKEYELLKSFPITRNNKVVKWFFLYKLLKD